VSGPGRRVRVVVLASGNGSNLQALLDASAAGALGAELAVVVSDRPGAYALERARLAGIPAVEAPFARGGDRRAYDVALAETVAAHDPDYVLLLGWMRILSSAFLSRFPGRVVNLHPALPGTFPGVRAIERAFEAYRAGAVDRTGVMTHLVPDEGVDSGPVLAVEEVPILDGDDLAGLEARIHAAEHRLVIETVSGLIREYGRRE
jgi:phosphoribosylglycinamide formyltransferase-1